MTLVRKAAGYGLMLLAGIAVGYLLLVCVHLLPVEPMERNVRASVPALQGEWGWEDAYEQLVKGYETTQLDNSTDAVMMLAAVYTSDSSAFVRAAEGRNYARGARPYDALAAFGKGVEMRTDTVARYWHGYLVFLKPLLMFMSYLDIRMVLMMVQGAMLTAVAVGLCKKNLIRLVPAFAVSMILITPSVTGFSMQFSTAFCTFLGAMIALLYLPEKQIAKIGLPRIFMLAGMTTSYVDYLTYPIATLGMPLCLMLFLFPKENWKAELRQFAACCLCWAFGYFGMWAGKWVIAGLLGDDPWFWSNLVAKIQQRSANESDQMIITYLDVLKTQLRPFAKRAYFAAAAALAAAWAAALIRRRHYRAPQMRPDRIVLVLITAALPFAWYFVTKNHSYNHAFFTSRALVVSAFAGCSLLMMLPGRKTGTHRT